MKRMFMAPENDKGSGGGVTPLNVKGSDKEAGDLSFRMKLKDRVSQWGEDHPITVTAGICVVGPVVGQRVVAPAYDWAKKGIVGLFAKKATDKVATETKNAISVGDVLGVLGDAVGVLIK